MSTTLIWILMFVVMGLSFIIQKTLQSRFEKYSQVPSPAGLTGAQVAEKMLRDQGINGGGSFGNYYDRGQGRVCDVKIQSVGGQLTDHYNPQNNTVNLSEAVYSQRSVAAAAVAAHECGHVIQHAVGYMPLRLRTALVPVVTFSNKLVSWVLLAGVLLVEVFPGLLWLGVALFAMSTLFSLVTLPVEIDASRRAVAWLESAGITDSQTHPMAVDALKWAAYTYVIAALGSLATLFYYIAMAQRRS